jgi:ADP-heptose:LPS heptosyltransferase
MQRMGDVVLSFPLLGWLAAAFPGHPLWVAGEAAFFKPLLPLSPQAVYFSPESLPPLAGQAFHAVLNLSHRPEAARLAAAARADIRVGPYLDAQGALRIQGDWQLYRASLTHNNRYNLFHWADLNALDLIAPAAMRATVWPPARRPPASGAARVGLFLGASEADKRPLAGFWARLARLLLQAGHKPVLLGGPGELELGRRAAARLRAPALNLCGRFSVSGLARFIAGLDLFITPDTGPMHVAAWTGVPLLNLSLGPVNAWETGPFAPGHHVLRPVLDCAGCWGCVRPRLDCRAAVRAEAVAALARALLAQSPLEALASRCPGLEIMRSARDAHGLFSLETLLASPPSGGFLTGALRPGALPPDHGPGDPDFPRAALALARGDLSRFWRSWFGALFRRLPPEDSAAAWRRLAANHPRAAEVLAGGLADLARTLAGTARSGAPPDGRDFWRAVPGPLRPLSSYIHLSLQNDPSRPSLLRAVSLVESLRAQTGRDAWP